MAAQHPHDHEQPPSELQEALDTWKAAWDKYGTHILLVILIVLAFFVFTRWYGGRQHRIMEEAYGALVDSETPRGKNEVAADFSHVPGLAGRAKLEAADLTLAEALNLLPDLTGVPTAAPTPEEMKTKLNAAAGLYKEVIDLNEAPLQVVNAHFGLAAVHESLGNFDEAGKAYDAAAAAAGENWPHLADSAERLKEELPRISKPVSFPKPKPLIPENPTVPENPVNPEGPSILDPDFKPGFTDPGTTDPDTPDSPDTPDTPDEPTE